MIATTARRATLAGPSCGQADALFPAVNGGYLDLGNFRNRSWKPAQLAAGIEPLRLAVAPSSRTRRR